MPGHQAQTPLRRLASRKLVRRCPGSTCEQGHLVVPCARSKGHGDVQCSNIHGRLQVLVRPQVWLCVSKAAKFNVLEGLHSVLLLVQCVQSHARRFLLPAPVAVLLYKNLFSKHVSQQHASLMSHVPARKLVYICMAESIQNDSYCRCMSCKSQKDIL